MAMDIAAIAHAFMEICTAHYQRFSALDSVIIQGLVVIHKLYFNTISIHVGTQRKCYYYSHKMYST